MSIRIPTLNFVIPSTRAYNASVRSPPSVFPLPVAKRLPETLHRIAPWIVVGLTLVGAGLRLYRLENQSVWWDEGASVFPARLPILELLHAMATDTAPPVYFILLKFWRVWVGDSEFSLRLLSAFFGVLLLPVAYRFVRGLAGKTAALISVALLCASRVLIWQSQELRFYSLAPLLAAISLLLAVRLWRGGDWRILAGYVAATALGLLTLYLFAGVLLAENLAFFLALPKLSHPKRQRAGTLVKWVSAQVLILVCVGPWILYTVPRLHPRPIPGATLNVWETARLYLDTLLVGDPNNIGRFWPFILAGLVLLVAGLGLALRERRLYASTRWPGVLALVMGAATSFGLVWLLNLPLPIQLTFTPEPRYFVTQVPWALMLLGIALAAILRRWPAVGLAATGLMVAGFAVFTSSYYSNRFLADDYKSAADTLRAFRQPGDSLIMHNDRDWPIVAYHVGNGFIGVNAGQKIASEQDAAAYTQAAWDGHDGVWLLVTPEALVNDPDHHVYSWLAARAVAQRQFDYDPTAELYFFARTAARAATIDQVVPSGNPSQPLHFSPAPGLTLVQATWVLPEYRVGDMLHLFLQWRNENAAGEYPFKVQLVTSQGVVDDESSSTLQVTAQSPALIRQQVDIPLHAFLAGGLYRLILVAGSQWTSLGQLPIASLPAASPLTDSPAQAAATIFESGIKLLGYTLTPGSNGHLTIELYWTATAPVDKSYKSFVHLRGPATNPATGNSTWAQDDHAPNLGATPTTTWRVGQTVRDTFLVTLPRSAPAGNYVAEVGWYDFVTGERLLVLDESGQAIDSQVALAPVALDPAR